MDADEEARIAMEINQIPMVYTDQYIFIRFTGLCHELLSSNDEESRLEGMKLLENVLNRVKENSLDMEYLDYLFETPVHHDLIVIMRFMSNKDHRLKGSNLFKKTLECFIRKARIEILQIMLLNPDDEFRASVLPLVLQLIKDYFFMEENMSHQFHVNLFAIIKSSIEICLPKKESTDLADYIEANCSLLNFLRFLLLKDLLSSNRIGIWDRIQKYRLKYLNVLEKALFLSRGYCKNNIQSVKEEHSYQKDNSADEERQKEEITILNPDSVDEPIPAKLSLQEKLLAINRIMLSLDMVESVLGRVNEIIDENMHKKINSKITLSHLKDCF